MMSINFYDYFDKEEEMKKFLIFCFTLIFLYLYSERPIENLIK